MPPFILAAIPIAIAGLVTVCGLALVVGPFVVPLWVKTMAEKDRLRLLAAVKGINETLGPLTKLTPTDLDDRVAQVLLMLEAEVGKAKAAKPVAVGIARAVVAKSVQK
jgi:hypothetical protein